jgi:hypothetical protein
MLKSHSQGFLLFQTRPGSSSGGQFFVPKRKKDPVLSLYRTFSALQHQNRVVFEVIHFS